jgi:hypothetical protein
MGSAARIGVAACATGFALGSLGCAAAFRDSRAPVRVESDPPGASVIAKEGTGVAPFDLPVSRGGITEMRVTMTGFDEHHALVRKHVNGWWLTADLATCIVPVLLCVPLLVDAISGAWNDVDPRYRAHLLPLGTGGVPTFGPDGSYYVLRPSEAPPQTTPAAPVPLPPPPPVATKASAAGSMSDSERKASARAAYQEGIELQAQKTWSEALGRFQFAQRLVDAPTHLLHIGECQVALGKLVEAQESYETLTHRGLPPGSPEPFREAVEAGVRELADLQPRIPTLRIEVRPAPERLRNLSLTLNGRPLPLEVVGIARPINPGSYEVTATAWGVPPARPVRVTLVERDARTVEVTLGAPAAR